MTNLANVYIAALVVNLRVVRVEKGGVNSSLGLDAIAGISITDDIGRRAVFSWHSETDGLAWLEVSTGRVDGPLINRGKLIAKNRLSAPECELRETTNVETLFAPLMLSQMSPSFTTYVLLQLAAVTAVPCVKQGKVKPRSRAHTLRNEWQRKEYKRYDFCEHGVNDSY